MYRNTAFALAWVMVQFLFNPPAWATDTMDAITLPVGKLTLSAPRGTIPHRTPVAFPHSRHFEIRCKVCHHTWDGYTPVSGCTASGCHDRITSQKENAPGTTSRVYDIQYFKSAYHQNCISCHRRLALERQTLVRSGVVLKEPLPKTGPTGCIGCHPKI